MQKCLGLTNFASLLQLSPYAASRAGFPTTPNVTITSFVKYHLTEDLHLCKVILDEVQTKL